MRFRGFRIPYGENEQHAAGLRQGLTELGPDFLARVCAVCEGEGRYRQMYTAGCGGGYYRSIGPCDWCDETGLLQGNKPAPASVINQVLVAAERASSTAEA